jgi:hypothetical protein
LPSRIFRTASANLDRNHRFAQPPFSLVIAGDIPIGGPTSTTPPPRQPITSGI